jgi:hypothetical protein
VATKLTELRNARLTEAELIALLDAATKPISALSQRMGTDAAKEEIAIRALLGELRDAEREVNGLAARFPTCDAFPLRRAEFQDWAADTAAYVAAVHAMVARAATVAKVAVEVQRLARSPEAFRLSARYGNFAEPARVEVNVERSPVGEVPEWRTVVTRVLVFGGGRRRFAVGAGGLNAWAPDAEYAAVRRYASPDPQRPADSTESVIVKTGKGQQLVSPILALTARLFDWSTSKWGFGPDGLHLLLASAPQLQSGNLQSDFVVGMALSFADERIHLGYGLTSRRRTTLPPGLAEGSRLPAAQTTVPTVTNRQRLGAVTVTMRLY